jgi:CHAT domain-containing protein
MTFRSLTSTLLLLLAALAIAPAVRAQEAAQDTTLIQMLRVYQSSGETALRQYLRSATVNLTLEQAQTYAQAAAFGRSQPLLVVLQILAEERQDSSSLAWVQFFRGYYLFLVGKNSEAPPFFEKALQFFEKVDDPLGQGNVYRSLGDIAFYAGANANAKEYYQKALPSFQKAGGPLGQGNVYMGLGDIAFYTGANARAEEYYQKALPFFQKADAPSGQGSVYRRLGDIALRTGANARAEEYCQKALPFFQKADDPLGQGNVYARLGDIALYTGANARAEEYYQKALPFYQKADAPLGQGNVYRSLGAIAFHTGANAKAEECYQNALLFFQKAGDPLGQGNVYASLGDIAFHTGANAKAEECYQNALLFFQKAGDPLGQGNVYTRLGDIALRTGANAKAEEHYQKAASLHHGAGAIENQSYAMLGMARVRGAGGKRSEAIALYQEALVNLEKVRGQTGSSESRMSYLEKESAAYEEVAAYLAKYGSNEKAFRQSEMMKARAFVDQMAESMSDVKRGISPKLKHKRDELSQRLSYIEKKMMEAGYTDSLREVLSKEHLQSEMELDRLIGEIRSSDPRYASVRYPQPLSVLDVENQLLEPNVALLEYLVTDSVSYVFVVRNGRHSTVRLSATRGEIEREVESYHENISIGATGEALYKMLLQPLESELEGISTLIIVPDGDIAKIPFEALATEIDRQTHQAKHYLIERYVVKYVQSATALSLLRSYASALTPTSGFIGFGDPVYDYENFVARKPERGGQSVTKGGLAAELVRGEMERDATTLNRLRFSGDEVRETAALFERSSTARDTLLRLQATEENVKDTDLSKYGYVLLSCHGVLGERIQGLVLSQIPDSKEDGLLTLGEIMNLNLNARLVVLSACETGRGRMVRGEGVVGLTRAVMYAGTPAVVVSLWSVSDEGTKELMVKFFTNLVKNKMKPEDALHQAKLEMLKTKWRSPFYWAPFVLYGE